MAVVLPITSKIKSEPDMYYPTPTSSYHHGRVDEESTPDDHDPSRQSMAKSFCTPRSNISEISNNEPSPAVTPTQRKHPELGSGGEGEEAGGIPGSPEDEAIFDDSPDASSPILERPHSLTPLGPLFQSPGFTFDDNDEMDIFDGELVGIPPLPLRAPTHRAEATAQLLHGIDNLSNWEPTPSIRGYSRRDCLPPTFDTEWGMWYNGSASTVRYPRENDTLYEELCTVQASRVQEEELRYGWELVEGFIQTTIWMSPARLGKQINRLVSGCMWLYPVNES